MNLFTTYTAIDLTDINKWLQILKITTKSEAVSIKMSIAV